MVCVYSAETGRVREYPEKVFLPTGVRTGAISMTAANPMAGHYRIDVESGEVTPVLRRRGALGQVSADVGGSSSWPADRRISVEIPGPVRRRNSMARGAFPWRSPVTAATWLGSAGLTRRRRVLKVMPFPDGTPKEIRQLRDSDLGIAWSPDGRFIYYSDLPPAGGKRLAPVARSRRGWRSPGPGAPRRTGTSSSASTRTVPASRSRRRRSTRNLRSSG